MRIAYILFDEITLLDFIGIYDPIKNIKTKKHIEHLDWDLCATNTTIKDSFGLEIVVDKIKPDLSDYDMVIVPGGFGTRALQYDKEFIDWLQTANGVKYLVSICTGSLLLGAAGFLKGKMATTNFNEYQSLEKYCDTVLDSRIVDDNNVITAGAVASSLDLGLYICKKLIGDEKAEDIRKVMDYHPKEFKITIH
ncbi:DJ-1/PfpI family protein [Aquimarina sp. BL5]|uniref:DJ-1/PfpI family protein n=1 Tax=Aquimarina sp. BL5 TaxID=1714860 RepID=UPI000E510094|nr:DJ-1/PfpI family protein [Aquimarina sp. BL5]AXT53908.1 DJ-1/PfpI family protein [Aquimarina sp. BL5]RKN00285.1 DJ-1/PfpI family protein [Aquimarina sp. BL5]